MGSKNIWLNNPDNKKSLHALGTQTAEGKNRELESLLHQNPYDKSLQDNDKKTVATFEGNSVEIVYILGLWQVIGLGNIAIRFWFKGKRFVHFILALFELST